MQGVSWDAGPILSPISQSPPVTQPKRPKRDSLSQERPKGKARQKSEESIRIYRNKDLPRVPDEANSSGAIAAAYLTSSWSPIDTAYQVTQAELNEFVLRKYAYSLR